MRVAGKVAIVTGAGRNIGEEIAATLAREGAKVVVNDLDGQLAQRTAQAITKTGGMAVAFPGNISNEEQVEAMVQQAVKSYGRLDILVNNVGITDHKTVLDITTEEWERVLNVVLTGTFFCCRFAARQMVKQGEGGVIINIASTSGHTGRPDAVAYCTAKGGILNFTRQLATSLAKYKIRVNSVSPRKSGTAVGLNGGLDERTFSEIPLGRLGTPRDQANAVLFLASEEASFITGADLLVDGGALAHAG